MKEIESNHRQRLVNNLFQLQRLQDEGVHVGRLPDDTWDKIVTLIEDGKLLEKPKMVPRPRIPECMKKHIKRSGKK